MDENNPDYVQGEEAELTQEEEELKALLEEQADLDDIEQSEEYVEALLDPSIFPKTTDHNIDEDCNFSTMFASDNEKDEFFTSLEQQCYLKNSCIIDPEKMLLNVTLEAGDEIPDDIVHGDWENLIEKDPNGKWYVKSIKMSKLVSEFCYRRIFDQEITNIEYIGIMGCISDKVKLILFPDTYFHKEELGIIVIFSDMISVVIMYYVFNKLKQINLEYLQILDNNVIKMQDFSI